MDNIDNIILLVLHIHTLILILLNRIGLVCRTKHRDSHLQQQPVNNLKLLLSTVLSSRLVMFILGAKSIIGTMWGNVFTQKHGHKQSYIFK